MTAWEILEAAGSHMRDRAATYDSPAGERSMAKTVAMFNAMVGREVMTENRVGSLCALLKLVRSEQGDFKSDNFEDLCAYGALAAEDGAAYFALAGEAAKASRGEAPQASGAIGPSILPDEEV
jgi:hypothetical protein